MNKSHTDMGIYIWAQYVLYVFNIQCKQYVYTIMTGLLHTVIHVMCGTSHMVTTLYYISTGCTYTGPSTPNKHCREAYLKECRQKRQLTLH